MALLTTAGGIDSNSYVTLAEADTYFENHYHIAKAAAWADLADEQKESVLKAATSILETIPVLDSEVGRVYWNQRLHFPRTADFQGSAYVVPEDVKAAQCEQAVYLLSVDESAMSAAILGLSREDVTAGGVRVVTDYSRTGSMVAPSAYEFMRPFIRKSNRFRRA